MGGAARCGNLDLLRLLYAHLAPDRQSNIMDYAVLGGNVAMTKWLHARGEGTGAEDLLYDMSSGNVEMVQWVHETYSDLQTTLNMMDTAASVSMEIVRFLHENRSGGCKSDAMDNAATNGKLELVRFLHANRTEGCSINAMDLAASTGQDGHRQVSPRESARRMHN